MDSDLANTKISTITIAWLMYPTMETNMMPISFEMWVICTVPVAPHVVVRIRTDNLRSTGYVEHSSKDHRLQQSIHKALISPKPAVIRPDRAVVKPGNDGFGGLLQRFTFDLDDPWKRS